MFYCSLLFMKNDYLCLYNVYFHAVLYLSMTVVSHAYCYNFVSCPILSLLVLPNSLLYRNECCSCSLFSFFLRKEHVPIEIVSSLIMTDESVVQRRFSTRIQINETEQSLFRKTGCCYHDESCKYIKLVELNVTSIDESWIIFHRNT